MKRESTTEALADAVCRAHRPAVAAALNLVEDRRPAERQRAAELLAALPYERLAGGTARPGHLVGITGPPGVGKSSLAAALIAGWRESGRTIGVLAVDPSSPRSGGALLGDRLRMLRPHGSDRGPDDGVFIRSLAGRGELGGLSAEVFPMSRILLAAFDVVLVETIGIGQTEIDVVAQTDTTVLVVQPAAGDTIQFLKAGILELPAMVAVNKADLEQPARRAAGELRAALPGSEDGAAWQVPVLLVSAATGQGIEELLGQFDAHHRWLLQGDRLAAQRAGQSAAWGIKRIALEFGRFGVEQLGGQAQLTQQWLAAGRTPFAMLEELRLRLLQQWRPGAEAPGD